MRVGIFYLSLTPKESRQPIALPNGGVVYVRVQEVNVAGLEEGLDLANPEDDESVMNSHEIEA